MSRLLFPAAIILILASVAFAHWETSGSESAPGTQPMSQAVPKLGATDVAMFSVNPASRQ
jgi:hypothetical protein